LGWMGLGWLAHILTEGDHRMSHVQAWVYDDNYNYPSMTIRKAH